MDINYLITKLVDYGIREQFITEDDRVFTVNQILDILEIEEYEAPEKDSNDPELEEILQGILDFSGKESVTERDLLDTKIMGVIIPKPSQVIGKFDDLYKISPKEATDYFYDFSIKSDYIRQYRIRKDVKWKVDSKYGEIDITINLSKPEKDPRDIAAAKTAKQSGYPKCLLCYENEGYAGRLNHPARQNLRVIPIVIDGTDWGFQYSPYVYYNEHCIAFNKKHVPMKVDESAFRKLIDFIKIFPHYFIGSNADLPIVGGSILSHDHFQGGNYEFSMAKAEIEQDFKIKGFEDVEAGILNWPLSVIRLRSKDSKRIIELSTHILNKWRGYTDEEAYVFAETDGEMHNSITPIARMKDGLFEMDLTLRNNITTDERPYGLYHPKESLHHIKKENIGLIEVMGLAVLPARLKVEMDMLAENLLKGEDISGDVVLTKHSQWYGELREKYAFTKENVNGILQEEIGKVFVEVLEDAGVYKCNELGRRAFMKFLGHI